MTEIQELQLKILCKFDEICRNNKLTYYLAYGTCLGAIRHKGFIPWDHDIDVLMPIEDAKKLETLQKEFGNQYFVQSYRTDPSYRTVSMRIIDKYHPCIIKKKGVVQEKTFLAMDVYPFYSCPKSKLMITKKVLTSHVYKLLVGGPPQNHGRITKILASFALSFYRKSNRSRDIQRKENELNYKGESTEIADYYGQDVGFLSAITYSKEWFSKPVEIAFEGKMFYAPTNSDKYLSKRYGDYMTPVSAAEQSEEAVIELL